MVALETAEALTSPLDLSVGVSAEGAQPLSGPSRFLPPQTAEPVIKVLLIEDNDGDFVLVREMISEINSSIAVGHVIELQRADGFSQGLELCKKDDFAVVLLDLSLPDTAREKTLRQFREAVPGCSVIVCSGLSDLDIAIQSVSEGAEDYLVKGQITPNVLYRSLLFAQERTQRLKDRVELESRAAHAERLKSLGLLSGSIAHDFNNILTIILANLELACIASSNPSQQQQAFSSIRSTVSAASGLTRQLLAYAGKCPLALERFSLSDAVDSISSLLTTAVQSQGELVLDLHAKLPLVKAARSQITQVVMNLVVNARDALNRDENGVIEVRTGVCETHADLGKHRAGERLAGECVYLHVRDNGPGIPEELQAQLFEPFFSTKGNGRGLGLSAVWGIVRDLKGDIWVKSEIGKGTTFTVRFPIDSEGEKRLPPGILNAPSGGTILVVEDDSAVNSATRHLLKVAGYDTRSAGDGKAAQHYLKELGEKIGLVLLDITLPDADGAEVLRLIRQEYPDLPVIVLGGYSPRSRFNVEVDKHLRLIDKPYSFDALLQEVSLIIPRASA